MSHTPPTANSNTARTGKKPISVIFFGSFLDYSTKVLSALFNANAKNDIQLLGVVTTPPKPAGRSQSLKYTDVHKFALNHNVPVFAPELLSKDTLIECTQALKIKHCDYFVTAGYGKLLPEVWLSYPSKAALNMHYSLLPKYRGANPGEWAILQKQKETGVSVIEMSQKFDTGAIVAQAQCKIENNETRETLYEKLYQLAADMIWPVLEADIEYRTNKINQKNSVATHASCKEMISQKTISLFYPPQIQGASPTPFARRLNKEDAWISGKLFSDLISYPANSHNSAHTVFFNDADAPFQTNTYYSQHQNPESLNSLKSLLSPFLYDTWIHFWQTDVHTKNISKCVQFLECAVRALTIFPCIWTTVLTKKGEKRLKIFSADVVNQRLEPKLVQLEGQQKAQWNQIKNNLIFKQHNESNSEIV